MNPYAKDYYIIDSGEDKILFHVPTLNICKISDSIASDLLYGEVKNHETKALFGVLHTEKKVEIPDFASLGRDCLEKSRLSNLTFLSAEICNLRCKYCFANKGTYGNNNGKVMTFNEYRTLLNRLLEIYTDGIETICFYGGEPLLGYRDIEVFIKHCNHECATRNLKTPRYTIITNGTLLTQKMIDFFNMYNISITISIDGPQHINDQGRIGTEGLSVYDSIVRNMKSINNNRQFVLAAEATITRKHVIEYRKGLAREWIDELSSLGFDTIIFEPVVTDDSEFCISIDSKSKFTQLYCEIVDYWFDKLTQSDAKIVAWDCLGITNSLLFRKFIDDCKAGQAIFISRDGDIYPCQLFYDVKQFHMGNLIEGINIESFKRISSYVNSRSRLELEECSECHGRYLCNQWCRGLNLKINGSMNSVIEPRCWALTTMIDRIIINLVKLHEDEEKYERFRENINKFNHINDLVKIAGLHRLQV